MNRRKHGELPTSRRHVHLYDEDWVFLTEFFSPQNGQDIGVSEAIRTILHARVRQLKAALAAKVAMPAEHSKE